MKIINLKKYANRKLYAGKGSGVGKSTYVNLREVADFIKQGYGLKVVRDTDKVDITNEVLREILTTSEVKLSNKTIRELIRS